jgi:hypothetical protein
MKTIGWTFLLLVGLSLTACSPRLSPFTQQLVEENGWGDAQLKKIQFYLSHDVVMRRQLVDGSSTIRGGEIKIENGKQIEQIVIPQGTPGVLLFQPKSQRFAIGFEEGSDTRYLMFGPNSKAGDKYVLLAAEWKNRQGKVTYEGESYWVDGTQAIAGLMVDLKRISKTDVKSRTAGGRTID